MPSKTFPLGLTLACWAGMVACHNADRLDPDGDGYELAEDCADEDPAVHPGAAERCDGVDNDCDGLLDDDDALADGEGGLAWADADGDGQGSDADGRWFCTIPAGYSSSRTDCDDGDAEVYAGAVERCNHEDDDCDGADDDEDELVAGWYKDGDGDHYGDPEAFSLLCDEDSLGWVNDDLDCDDDDDQVHPGASETDCTDPNDYNCDGSVGYADADADGYVACQECDDATAAEHPGASETCDGDDDDCDGEIDEIDASDARTWYADDDGDGYGDAADATTACFGASHDVLDGTDCDDADPDYHPGADESDCQDPNDYNCDGSVGYADADGDGFAACGDCQDSSTEINPDAEERCDGVDNDCDGIADGSDSLDASTWYNDGDGDGYGDPGAATAACTQPSGAVNNDDDCDDDDGDQHPGGVERCDGADNDCDGSVDEADAADAPTWYADGDGDGAGDALSSTSACSQPSGYVATSGDCDDDDPAIGPDLPELCDDADLDEDCDGLSDDADGSATGQRTWHADADGDGYGDGSSATSACDAPASSVADATDCDDSDAAVHPDAPERCDGGDDDCDGETDEDDAIDPSTWYADADADGFGDPSASTTACEAPDGYVSDSADCDDRRQDVSPDGAEVCDDDDVDEDCDGAADDADPGVETSGLQTWYVDSDGDGYGDSGDPRLACDPPSGAATVGGDCDDGDLDYHPGADELDCSSPNDFNCDGSVGYADADADGWAACLDCDDGAASASPSAAERCDGVDDDCDGEVDEDDAIDPLTWHLDADGDGFGDPDETAAACDQPSGYLSDDTDCLDSDDTVYPGAAERCDDVDDDCDGTIDEPEAVDASLWYADADGDGFGDPAVSQRACAQPARALANDEDCDDADASVSPADQERCDGVDDDCDGEIDEHDAEDAVAWHADADGDGYGDPEISTLACSAPARAVADDTDCDDTRDDVSPGSAEICDDLDVDEDCDGTSDDTDPSVAAGSLLAWYTDDDGDGHGDTTLASVTCEAPSRSSASSGDCDDGDPAFYPGAAEGDCADPNDYNCDGSTGYVDGDGDDWAACEDCDDGDSAVNPGAFERCDDLDDDCDGTIDEDDATDASDWYADDDGDGYGDPSEVTVSCDAPTGAVADATDCDPLDGSVSPRALELCDTIDNDCDGEADESDALDASTWYADDDGDGFGDPLHTLRACALPEDGSEVATDCDDENASRYPGAPEVCSDAVLNDCDGGDAEAELARLACRREGELADTEADVAMLGVSAGAKAGSALAGGVLAGDSAVTLVVGARNATVTGLGKRGAVYLLRGPLGSTSLLDDGSAITSYLDSASGASSGAVGESLSLAPGPGGEANGRLLIGAPDSVEAGVAVGAAYLVEDLAADGALSDVASAIWWGETSAGGAGKSVTALGSQSDGATLLAVGAWKSALGGATAGGAVFVVDGDATGELSLLDDARFILETTGVKNAYLGYAIEGSLDWDGDGFDDLVVGAYGKGLGTAWLLTDLGSIADGTTLSVTPGDGTADSDATTTLFSATTRSGLGIAFGVGDLSGDGRDDLLVGHSSAAVGASFPGGVFVLNGPAADAEDVDAITVQTEASASLFAPTDGDFGGEAIAVGDVDLDGQDDLIIGAHNAASDAGRAWLVYGPVSGTYDLTDADLAFTGSASAYAGLRMCVPGDLSGDGYPDLAIGGLNADAPSTSATDNSGAVWLLFGAGL